MSPPQTGTGSTCGWQRGTAIQLQQKLVVGCALVQAALAEEGVLLGHGQSRVD